MTSTTRTTAVPDRQTFRDLRARNERRARIAQLMEAQRARRSKIEQVLQVQRRFRKAG